MSERHLTGDTTSGRGAAGLLGLYTWCVFASAWLLFMVEPMVAKMLLPLVGGAAAVWTTSVLFFQCVLLAGYAYAHFVATRLSTRLQVASHVILLLLAVLTLPIGFAGAGVPAPGRNPAGWLLVTLLLRVGLPFLCLTTLSPLLQSWFVRAGHPHGDDPYFLYRASNLGSFGALIAYPVVVERFSGLGLQTRAWQAGYILLVAFIVVVGVLLWRSHATPDAPVVSAADERIAPVRFGRWVALAAVPSLWMLAVTTYFTTQIRPIPLLWVIPLALYLLSFAIVFARRPIRLTMLARTYPYIAVLLLGLAILGANKLPFLLAAVLQFGAFFVGALVCHGQLAADRPPAGGLTVFYLALAVGGAVGGLLGAIVAPAILPDLYEFPLAIIITALLLPRAMPADRRDLVREATGAAVVAVALFAVGAALVVTRVPAHLATVHLTQAGTLADLLQLLVVVPIPALAAVAFSRRPAGLAVVLATIFGLARLPLGGQPQPLYVSRDFFGVHQVVSDVNRPSHIYENGGVIHGIQLQDPPLRDLPATYFSPSGPAGDVLQRVNAPGASIAVVGLGAGSLACYSKPGQSWTFYEIDPEVVRIARDPSLFTFLRDCTPRAPVVLGDGRVQMETAASRSYDLVVIDVFSGDAPPVHVLTREALALYESKLRPGGIVLINISNSYINFRPVVAATGASLGLRAYARQDTDITPVQRDRGKTASDWMVLVRDSTDAASLIGLPGWAHQTPDVGAPVWTDDYSNLLSVLRLF
ncbi:MAG: spermidine synthase [Candidatus Dormibacteria bacterium]